MEQTGRKVFSRSRAKEALQGQLAALDRISATWSRGSEGVLDRQLAYQSWWGDARAVALHEFDGQAVADELLPVQPAFPSPTVSLDAQFRAVNSQIDKSRDRLYALINGLDGIPEVDAEPPSRPSSPRLRFEPEQVSLLVALVDAFRTVPSQLRQHRWSEQPRALIRLSMDTDYLATTNVGSLVESPRARARRRQSS
jgi:hypothetical protein